jgi:hypothetical protein
VPAGWVTADEADGGSPALRGWLEARQLLYVLAVKATEPLPPASGPAMPAARLAGRTALLAAPQRRPRGPRAAAGTPGAACLARRTGGSAGCCAAA